MNPKNVFYLLFISFHLTTSYSQNSIISSGGDVFGVGGSCSYSVGQITYLNYSGSNGSISEGVQHPYEIITLGLDHNTEISLLMVYPNPFSASTLLSILDRRYENLKYQLFDLNGKKLTENKITQSETFINLGTLNAAVYLLQIIDDDEKIIKTFKIIKK